MTPLRVQAAACTLSFSGSSDLSRGILPRTFFLSFRGAKRRGICCSPIFGQKQISRFARNDNAWDCWGRAHKFVALMRCYPDPERSEGEGSMLYKFKCIGPSRPEGHSG